MKNVPNFDELAERVSEKKIFQGVFCRMSTRIQYNPYKVEKLSTETAKKIYAEIRLRHHQSRKGEMYRNVWNENERRIFIWYMIIYLDLYGISQKQEAELDWESLSNVFFGKNPPFLKFQLLNVHKYMSKICWTNDEDKVLLEAIATHKRGKWNQIAKSIYYESGCQLFKSPKHCRERWFNHLDLTKQKGQWTPIEDYLIVKYIGAYGKRWAVMVRLLQRKRTEHTIKNRYNSLIVKAKKFKKRKEEELIGALLKEMRSSGDYQELWDSEFEVRLSKITEENKRRKAPSKMSGFDDNISIENHLQFRVPSQLKAEASEQKQQVLGRVGSKDTQKFSQEAWDQKVDQEQNIKPQEEQAKVKCEESQSLQQSAIRADTVHIPQTPFFNQFSYQYHMVPNQFFYPGFPQNFYAGQQFTNPYYFGFGW